MAFTERYVTSAAGGGGVGTEGDPWTFAEALTSQAAGDRTNVKSDAGYSVSVDAFTNAGTVFDWIVMRGYNSTIGDLDGQGRNSNGTINKTNFPALTLTGLLTPNTFCFMQNFAITGALSSPLIGSTTVDNFGLLSCEVINTQNNASAIAVQGDNAIFLQDNDLECTGASHGVVVDLDNVPTSLDNRIKANANNGFAGFGGTHIGNVLIGDGSSIAFKFINRQINNQIFYGNTIYNWGTAIQMSDNAMTTTYLILRNNHITDCTKIIDDLYVGTDSTPIFESHTRNRDNTTPRTGVGDGFNIAEVTTDTGGPETDYTNAGADDLSLIAAAPGVDAGGGFGT